MKKSTAMVIGILLLAIILSGCGRQAPTKKTTKTTTTGAGKNVTTSPANTEVPPGEMVKEIDYDAMFHLQYCNATIGDLDYQSSKAKGKQEDAEKELSKLQGELSDAQTAKDDDKIKVTQRLIAEKKTDIETLKKQVSATESQLAEKISKCSTLEKKKDATICKEFVADAQHKYDTAKSELDYQQKEVDTATSLNQQERLVREKRLLTRNQVILKRILTQYNDLATKCGVAPIAAEQPATPPVNGTA